MKKVRLKFMLMAFLVAGFMMPVTGTAAVNGYVPAGLSEGEIPDIDISGTVKDSDGEPLIGVNVVVKGSTKGTSTDFDGEFSLEEVDESAILVFSYIGYQTLEVAVDGRSQINVVMQEDLQQLDEIVVVGYGTQKKANLVGAVTAVSGAKIEAIPAPDVSNAIAGRLPGTTIMQGSGEPGQDAARIMIRGRSTLGKSDQNENIKTTNPLVVIDGIPGRSLTEIDPVDIESISVLKDASAAIYGSAAANGVILVTTKRGESGYPRLSYQAYQGFMTPTILPKRSEEHTSELQSRGQLVCRLLLEKKQNPTRNVTT